MQVKTVPESLIVFCKIVSINSAADHHITSKNFILNKDTFIYAIQKFQLFLLSEN